MDNSSGARPSDQALASGQAPAGLDASRCDPSRMDETDWHVLAQTISDNWSDPEERGVAYQAAAEALKLFRREIERRDRNETRNCLNWGPCSQNSGHMSEETFPECICPKCGKRHGGGSTAVDF